MTGHYRSFSVAGVFSYHDAPASPEDLIMPTVQEIAQAVNGSIQGVADACIQGVESVEAAQPGQITFIRDDHYARKWPACGAWAAIVPKDLVIEPGDGKTLIRVANPDLAMAQVLALFAPTPIRPPAGTHPTALVDPTATLGSEVTIGAYCVVGRGVTIAAGCILHQHVTVLDDVRLGPDCELEQGVVIRERCVIGARCHLHAHVVIGGDGFGYRPAADGRGIVKIPHIGSVRIEDDVEIGAGTTIDRAKFGFTTIGAMTKIDNLCQIAHNVRIGKACFLAAQVGVAGSTVLEDGVMLGGQVGVRDHVVVGAGVKVAACSAVATHVPPGAEIGGLPAHDLREFWKEYMALRKLPDLMKDLRELVRQARAAKAAARRD